jgi:capsular polysaccharide biosynthesis protein
VPPPGVYLRRGIGGEPRRLINEAELEQALLALGFDILDPENLSAQDVAQRSLGARVVIAVEGSHLSHAIFSAAEQATFMVIQPPDRFALAYKEYTDRMDMRFALVVAEPASGGFSVVIDEVHRLLELLP